MPVNRTREIRCLVWPLRDPAMNDPFGERPVSPTRHHTQGVTRLANFQVLCLSCIPLPFCNPPHCPGVFLGRCRGSEISAIRSSRCLCEPETWNRDLTHAEIEHRSPGNVTGQTRCFSLVQQQTICRAPTVPLIYKLPTVHKKENAGNKITTSTRITSNQSFTEKRYDAFISKYTAALLDSPSWCRSEVLTWTSVLIHTTGLYSLTWTVLAAGCFISIRRSPSSCSLFTSLSWDSRLLFLKFYKQSTELRKTPGLAFKAGDRTGQINGSREPHHVATPDVRRIHHAVAPVLLEDLRLFVAQVAYLFITAVHVLVQAVQVVLAPFRVVLHDDKKTHAWTQAFLVSLLWLPGVKSSDETDVENVHDKYLGKSKQIHVDSHYVKERFRKKKKTRIIIIVWNTCIKVLGDTDDYYSESFRFWQFDENVQIRGKGNVQKYKWIFFFFLFCCWTVPLISAFQIFLI